MTKQEVIDLRPTLRAILRHWLVLLSTLLLGAVGGFLYTVVQTPTYVAQARVLLPASGTDANGQPLHSIDTEVAIAQSAQVLNQAGKEFTPALDAASLRDRTAIRSVTPDILEIQAEAPSSKQAAMVANAVARAYVAVSTSSQFSANRAGTQVLDQATAPTGPARPRLLWDVGAGALVGLLLGALLALLVDHGRLHRRDDIAQAVGTPVLASLTVLGRVRSTTGRHLLARWAPSVVERNALRQAVVRLWATEPAPPANVIVVSLAGDQKAPLTALQLAVFGPAIGARTAFIVATKHPTTAGLWAACDVTGPDQARVRPELSAFRHTNIERQDLDEADLTIVSVVADAGPVSLPTWDRRTVVVLAVSAGFAKAEMLVSVAAACGEAGHPVRGVFVVNADPQDVTRGRLTPSPMPGMRDQDASFAMNGAVSEAPDSPGPKSLDPRTGVAGTALQGASGHPAEVSPFVDVPRLFGALRRRSRLWVTTGLGGLLCGLAVFTLAPPPYSATTTLFLRHPATSDSTRAMATDLQVVASATVAQRVVDQMGLPLRVDQFRASYTATSLSDMVMKITAVSETGQEAMQRAKGVANAFLDLRRQQVEQGLQTKLSVLNNRQRALNDGLATINASINSLSASTSTGGGPASQRAQLNSLLAQRATTTQQLADVQSQIDQASLETAFINGNSRVLDPAIVDPHSTARALATDLGIGLALGLSLGWGGVVLSQILSPRAWRRRDVMASLGTPVAVSVGPPSASLASARRRLAHHLVKPQRDLSVTVGHLRASLYTHAGSKPALAVVSVGSDAAAALAVASLAIQLSREGNDVLVADLTQHSVLAGLLKLRPRGTARVRMGRESTTVWVAFPSIEPQDGLDQLTPGSELAGLRSKSDVVLALATVDPARGAGHLLSWSSSAVAVVTAGRSTDSALASVSHLLRVAGLQLSSAVLVRAARNDATVGIPESPPEAVPARQRSMLESIRR